MTSNGFAPNTTITILRTDPDAPDAVDEYGDPRDTDTPVATGIPASILQQNERRWLPADRRLTVVETHTGRLRAGTDIRGTDRLKDEPTGDIYTIENLAHPQAVLGARPAIRLDLRKIS